MSPLDQILGRMNDLRMSQRLGVSDVRIHHLLSEPFNPTLKTMLRVCSELNFELRIAPHD